VLAYALQNKIAYESVGESLLYLAPLQGPEKQMGVVQLQYSLKSSQSFQRTLQNLFLSTGIAVLVFSFILGYLYFNRAAAAIRRLKKAAEDSRADYMQPLRFGVRRSWENWLGFP
jgi:hypothetical protein